MLISLKWLEWGTCIYIIYYKNIKLTFILMNRIRQNDVSGCEIKVSGDIISW